MAKNDKSNQDPKAPEAPSPAEQENLKVHGDTQGVEAREVEAHELNAGVVGREVSDEDLKAMEEANKEPNLGPEDNDTSDEGKVMNASSVPSGAVPSPDAKDYVYRDVLGTSIVGYQEQVPREDV